MNSRQVTLCEMELLRRTSKAAGPAVKQWTLVLNQKIGRNKTRLVANHGSEGRFGRSETLLVTF